MAYADLRQLVSDLERQGRLTRVTAEVDKDWEIACVARWVMESFDRAEPFALCFDNVRGFDDPVVVGLFASLDLYATALETTADQLLSRWSRALRQPIPPREVETAPVKDIVAVGEDVDLRTLPVPVWTPGRDEGPYIPSASVITRDPGTGVQNMAVYRIQVHDRSTMGLFFGTDRQHGAIHYARHAERGESMPVAIVIGGPPAVLCAAPAKTAYGVDELAIAGGLTGEPIEVVRCETIDLLVPARAEYVIEGLVLPGARASEGPFGEALGYMNLAAPAPFIKVTAVCRRRQPLFHGYVQQLPPSEGHLVWEMGVLGSLWHYVCDKMKIDAIRDLAIVRGSAGVSMLAVQLALGRGGDSAQVAKVLSAVNFGQKFILIVDEDIDIRDLETLQWAMSTRADPARDVQIVPGITAYQADPSVLSGLNAATDAIPPPPYTSSMMIVDATVKSDVPDISLPIDSFMQKARRRWSEYGLPVVPERARLTRLLEHHAAGGDWFRIPRARQTGGTAPLDRA